MREMCAKIILLMGMKCAGKSSVGSYLASHFHFSFLDLDAVIEQEVCQDVRNFYKAKGRESFQIAEYEALKKCFEFGKCKLKNSDILILSCGGGTLENEMAIAFLKQEMAKNEHDIRIFFLHLQMKILFNRIIKRAKKEKSMPAFLEHSSNANMSKCLFWKDKQNLKKARFSFFQVYKRRMSKTKNINCTTIKTKGMKVGGIANKIIKNVFRREV